MANTNDFIAKLQSDPALAKQAEEALKKLASEHGVTLDNSDLDSVAGGGGSCGQAAWTAACTF